MKLKVIVGSLAFLLSASALEAQEKVIDLKFVQTSDVHGNYFPYSFTLQKDWIGSLSRVAAFVKKERQHYGENLVLMDNGDILQGQPSSYYYNYIDTVSTHVCADMMNYMGYNVGNMGNHDVETGHNVYDRWINECNFPVLGANIIRTSDGEPYLPPYTIMKRSGIKIAILGLITPAIPAWLSENLWHGLRFDDMEESARKWMKVIRDKERPDIVIGLFHAGQESMMIGGKYKENASLDVARNVPGFDIVMIGHDHIADCKKIANVKGDSVLIIDPANNAELVSNVTVKVKVKHGRVRDMEVKGELTDMNAFTPCPDFMTKFSPQFTALNEFVSKRIGYFTKTISSWEAYLGPSAFVDLIHELQLEISGAEISFTAPLSFDAKINKGDVRVSDMFNLYKYENMLYTMMLSGEEIKNYLEESYYWWTNQMKSPWDHLLWLNDNFSGHDDRSTFKNYSFNFDSAAGIIYTVDVTKPRGSKITIVSMANGNPFSMDKMYKVALNSYRGNGGGELLTKGAGLTAEDLTKRLVCSTDKDLRYYLMQYIDEKDTIVPKALHQWKFIPEEWTVPAAKRDGRLLFNRE